LVIKFSEKESFVKSFLLFFVVIVIFLLFILYDKLLYQTVHIKNNILLEMKNYSLSFSDKRFNKKIVKKEDKKNLYTLYEDIDSLFILVPMSHNEKKKEMIMIVSSIGSIMVPYSNDDTEVIQIWYSKVDYQKQIRQLQYDLLWELSLLLMGALLSSLLAAWYTLHPLRSSLHLLEDFIKDIIHDLNTPLTSIILNLKMIEVKNEEIESIRTATQTIEMLHHNLDAYLRDEKQNEEIFYLDEVLNRYIIFFTPLYDYITWNTEKTNVRLLTDKQAFSRIIYNLLSNACKYNTSNGKIEIYLDANTLYIRNSSYGVKNPNKVFERFYKESERGMGIGLHIVDKLCQTLNIDREFRVEGSDVLVSLECKTIISMPTSPSQSNKAHTDSFSKAQPTPKASLYQYIPSHKQSLLYTLL
jgi:two-component system OmpR family sensor kinase